jgi:hypothetical protein
VASVSINIIDLGAHGVSIALQFLAASVSIIIDLGARRSG